MIPKRALARAVLILAAIALFGGVSSSAQLTTPSAIHVPVIVAGERKVIDFEPFTLWAAGGGVLVHDGTGVVRHAPPDVHCYRGRSMNGGDFASLMVDGATGDATGLMVLDGKRYVLSGSTTDDDGRRKALVPQITAVEAEDTDIAAIAQWRCSRDGERPARTPIDRVMAAAAPPAKRDGIGASQSYVVTLDVETDYDLYLKVHDIFLLQGYVMGLTAAINVIMQRDLNVTLQLNSVNVYMTPEDNPWHAQPSQGVNAALYELGDYYQAHYSSSPRSAVVLLSGKPFNAGTAWEGALCLSPRDFYCSNGSCGDPAADGHYGGAYAVSGSIVGPSFIPNPNGTLPASGFWDLQDYAHEVGHILGGHHTNCIALTPAEQGQTGRSWVDECASDEYGCYSGSVFSPPEGGTIMSSCFNLSPTTSRYSYGSPYDMSHHEIDDYLKHSGGTVGGLPNVDSATTSLTLSPINAPSSVPPNSSGNVASITAVSGATYSWSISSDDNSGSAMITAGGNTNSVTFSTSSSGTVTLTVYLYNPAGCAGLSESKTLALVGAPAAPTGLVATAASSNSVDLWWNQVTGSSIYYTIYRSSSTGYQNYSIVGCTQTVPGSLSPYVDAAFVNGNASYLYKVTATSGTFNPACPQPSGGESGYSNIDLATTVTIPPIAVGLVISSDHINYLRSGALALHQLANGAGTTLSFTDATVGHCATDPSHCIAIKAVHINELRSAINADRQTVGLPAWSFTTPVLTGCTILNPSQCIVIRTYHFSDLRDAIQ